MPDRLKPEASRKKPDQRKNSPAKGDNISLIPPELKERFASTDMDLTGISLPKLIKREDLQQIQDSFSNATGVASIITEPDGTPITKPSNFCRLCSEIIRKTEKGLSNCIHSDAVIGRYNPEGPVVQQCLSGGLWDSGASITVGDKHIANWLIGQVRNEKTDTQRMRDYAKTIGVDEQVFFEALQEVPVMSSEQFENISQALFLIANQLSQLAYQNLLLEQSVINQERNQAALAESERKFRRIYDHIIDVYYETTVDGTILEISPSIERLSKYTRQELIGSSLFPLYPNRHDRERLLKTLLEDGNVRNYEVTLVDKDGKKHYGSINVDVIPGDSPSQTRLVGVLRDITERRQIQEIMLQNEKMISVGTLASGMAHEINNPLAGIIQNASVINNRLGGGSNIPANRKAAEESGTTMEAINRYMEKRGIFRMLSSINEAGRRMNEIIENMLSFVRKADASFSSQDPAVLLDRIVDIAATDYDLKKRYDFKSIEIIKEYEDNLPMIVCEKTSIQQVLLNILKNGSQAMQEHKVYADGEKPRFILRLATEMKARMLRIEIEDNGPGMDEQTRKRIFEPFFTTKPEGIGTGLGLSISYFIITKNHGGEIRVKSDTGSGTTFIIRLPLNGKSSNSSPPESAG